jgi:hypothetical protein
MISFITSRSPLERKLILYSEKPTFKLGLFDEYLQSFSVTSKMGFKRFPKYTKVIDLTNESFADSFSKTTQYEIRRAKSDGIICETTYNIKEFVEFHNKFVEKKKVTDFISVKELEKFGESLFIRVAGKEGLVFVYHSYLYDWTIRRARLLHSVSNIYDASLTPENKALSGRANRLLMYDDMLYFKEMGCLKYDLGGYAYNTNDKSLVGINSFKDSFGGSLVEESNYIPYFLFMIRRLKNILRKPNI